MINLLSMPVDQIIISDIESLIESKIPEGEQVEFKEELPAKNGSDPWMSGGDKIGDRAKNELLKEVVAFSNGHGGALLLGIGESATKPAVADKISPIPRCADLVERLKLVFRDRVEPQLPRIEIFAVPTEGDSGVIVFRVGKSRLAPHRVTGTLVCPVRRADRCEEMTMREIQDMTLNVTRGLERLERQLLKRAERFREDFERLNSPDDAFGIRLTAAPVGDEIRFDRVFNRGAVIDEFDIGWLMVGRQTLPSHLLPIYWRPILRGARAETSPAHQDPSYIGYRELHCDGLVEWDLVSVSSLFRESLLSPDWPIIMFANVAVWADHVRKQALAPTMEYALEVEIRHLGGTVRVGDDDPLSQAMFSGISGLRDEYPPLSNIVFPRYPLNNPDDISRLLALFRRDFWDSLGKDIGVEQNTLTIRRIS